MSATFIAYFIYLFLVFGAFGVYSLVFRTKRKNYPAGESLDVDVIK